MKLLYCKRCKSIFNLCVTETKRCSCGMVEGRYIDEINAEYEEYADDCAVPLGIGNEGFVIALRARPKVGMGFEFPAWVMPEEVSTFKKRGK